MLKGPTTPQRISDEIRRFCRDVVPNSEPQFIDVAPEPDANVNDCVCIVARHVEKHGGQQLLGRQILEWPGVMLEAEFHAVWRDEAGRLLDLTPKERLVERILFLPDPNAVYEGRQVNSIRRPVSGDAAVQDFIFALDAKYELENRGDRAFRHGEIRFRGDEADEYEVVQRRIGRAYARILSSLAPSPRSDDPCPCGSGKKFKRCHGSKG